MAQIIILLGPPGAGKTTEAEILAQELGYIRVPIGNLARKLSLKKSALGKQVKKYVDKGALVPDKIINLVASDYLIKNSNSRGFVFDSFPRNVLQAEFLDKIVSKFKWPKKLVFCLQVSDKEVVKRLSIRRFCLNDGLAFPAPRKYCPNDGSKLIHRSDDKISTINKRLLVWHKLENELKAYYSKFKNIFIINGERKILEVRKELHRVVVDKIKNS